MGKATLFTALSAAALFSTLPAAAVPAPEPFEWKSSIAENELTVSVTVAPEHYFYANESFQLNPSGRDGGKVETLSAPQPLEIDDEFMGRVKIYPAGTWVWKFRGTPPFSGTVHYQGCRKAAGGEPALCFMPETVLLAPKAAIAVPRRETTGDHSVLDGFTIERKAIGFMDATDFRNFLAPGSSSEDSATENSGGMFGSAGIWLVMLLALLGGLGLNLTPCVLPMIPVNLAIIGADGAGRKTGFLRGLSYGSGMATAYGMLGAVVILTGARFGDLNSSSAFNFAIAAAFLILAAATFGVFRIDFSGSFRLSPKQLAGGKTVIAFVMGAAAALLAGACVAPVVIGVLLFSAELYNRGNSFALGLPFLLGVGMALPWPAAGAGLGVLPKPGRFMLYVKNAFGIIILLAALRYGWIGLSLLEMKFPVENEMAKLEQGIAESRATGKPVLIDFRATWCRSCKDMERNVLPDPQIQELLKRYVVVKFQAERMGEPQVRSLLDRCGVPGLPAFVILAPAK